MTAIAPEAVRSRFLAALLEEDVWSDRDGHELGRTVRGVRVEATSGRAVVRRYGDGEDDRVRIELPLPALIAALPVLVERGRAWFQLGDDAADAVASLLTALEEAVDSDALDGADDLVLDRHGLFTARGDVDR